MLGLPGLVVWAIAVALSRPLGFLGSDREQMLPAGGVSSLKAVTVSPLRFALLPLVVLLAVVSWASGQWTYTDEDGEATITA